MKKLKNVLCYYLKRIGEGKLKNRIYLYVKVLISQLGTIINICESFHTTMIICIGVNGTYRVNFHYYSARRFFNFHVIFLTEILCIY